MTYVRSGFHHRWNDDLFPENSLHIRWNHGFITVEIRMFMIQGQVKIIRHCFTKVNMGNVAELDSSGHLLLPWTKSQFLIFRLWHKNLNEQMVMLEDRRLVPDHRLRENID